MKKRNQMHQVVDIDESTISTSRKHFLISYIKNKNVLHVGFVDYPITDIKKNIHLALSLECKRLDGIDPNITAEVEKLLTVPNGSIIKKWDDVKDEYDVIIVPEVLEHVGNAEDFLTLLDQYNSMLIITVPDIYQLKDTAFFKNDGSFIECVHPDHNCWYSPYTFKNIIKKYIKNKKTQKLFFIESSIAVVCY